MNLICRTEARRTQRYFLRDAPWLCAIHFFYTEIQTASEEDISFKDFEAEASQTILIVRSFQLINKRIGISNLSPELKNLFARKLEAFYDCKLELQLKNIVGAVGCNTNMKDELTDEIDFFLKNQTNRTG